MTATLKTTLHYGSGWSNGELGFPSNLSGVITWLQGLLDSVPEEHRSNVIIEFDSDGDYDDPGPKVTIYYERPETDEELRDRQRRNADRIKQARQRVEAAERQKLAELLAKYGSPS